MLNTGQINGLPIAYRLQPSNINKQHTSHVTICNVAQRIAVPLQKPFWNAQNGPRSVRSVLPDWGLFQELFEGVVKVACCLSFQANKWLKLKISLLRDLQSGVCTKVCRKKIVELLYPLPVYFLTLKFLFSVYALWCKIYTLSRFRSACL